MKRLKDILFATICIALAAIVLTSCHKRKVDPRAANDFTIYCDESVENILRQEVQVYELKFPATHIDAVYTDETTVFDSLRNLNLSVYITATELSDDQIRFLKANQRNTYCVALAVDAIAIIANADNPVDMLSIQQLADILTGETKSWNDISPSKLGEIKVAFDNDRSSTVKYMMKNVTGGKRFSANVYAQKTNAEVFKAVKANKDAIGIIGVSWLSRDLSDIAKAVNYSQNELKELENKEVNHNIYSEQEQDDDYSETIKVVPIRKNNSPYAYKPFQYDIYTGDYPLFRTIYAICTSPVGTPQHAFCRFMTSIPGQKVILNTGVMPANVPPQRAVVIQSDDEE